jgi:predicted PurR-regulated permease PerM
MTDPAATAAATDGRWPDMRWIRRLLFAVFAGVTLWQLAEWLFFGTRSLILTLVLAWFAAIAMEPAVEWFERRGMRRGAATGLIMLGGFLAFALFIAVFGQLLFDQLASLVKSLPNLVDQTVAWVNDRFNANLDPNNILTSLNIDTTKINSWAANIAGGIFGVVNAVVGFVFRAFTVLLFTFYFAAEGPRFRRFVASLFPPAHQPIIDTVWATAIEKTGGYVISRLVLAILSAALTSVFLLAIGVPYWLPLGIWVGVISQFIPTIGTYLAGALPVAIGLLQSLWTGVWVLVFILVYQQVENYFFSPKISNRTMQIHPAVAFGAVIVGGALFGPWGALVAIPAVASIQALFETYGHRFELVEAANHGDGAGTGVQDDDAVPAGEGPGS